MRFAVIGGMNMDLLGVPEGTLLPRDSTPGRVIMRPGGVGRNIAVRLRQMGAQVHLITALGNDDRARLLRSYCLGEGLDLSLSVQAPFPCPTYLCIHDERGDMAAAINDMAAMDRLTGDVIARAADVINACDGCILDANLPKETLEAIPHLITVPLMADPVSAIKAHRLRGILPYLAAIKPNQLEAAALTGRQQPPQAAQALLEAGVKNVFISLGAEGVYYANEAEQGVVPALPLPHVPLTGAGDALCAGLAVALSRKMSPRECARAGCAAAHDALMAAAR